jgi:2-methylisocitrate lyase-like PEP mutase family enzyme
MVFFATCKWRTLRAFGIEWARNTMDIQVQIDRALAFRKMHDRTSILLLPNAWDAGSARVLAKRGFAAIATTSGGMAWSLGYADGEQAPLAEVLAAIARITRVVDPPVTADIEGGYGETPAAVEATVRAVIAAGVAGINLEDGMLGGQRSRDDAARRIHAARAAAVAAGVPIVINARIDNWLLSSVNDDRRFDDALKRAEAYLAAGADCIYPIGLDDSQALAALVRAIDAPVNVGAHPGLADLASLACLGVARVSTATRLAAVAWSALDRAAADMRESGRFDGLGAAMSHADMQHLFSQA